MVGWWASENKPQSPFNLMVFSVQYFQQGDLALLKWEGIKIAKILTVHEIYKTRAYYNIVSQFYIHASVSDQSIPPIPHHEYIYVSYNVP